MRELRDRNRSSAFGKILLIAWRDFRHTALTKMFIFAGLVLPLAIFGMIFLMAFLFRPNVAPLEGTLAIADPAGEVAAAARIEFEPERLRTRVLDVMEAFGETPGIQPPIIDLSIERVSLDEVETTKQAVRDGEYVALAVIPGSVLATSESSLDDASAEMATLYGAGPAAELFIPSGFAPNHTRLIEHVLRDAVVRARIQAAGQDVQAVRALVARPRIQPVRLGPEGAETEERLEAKMMIPMAFMMLLWITTFTSGNYLLTSTIEEKSNRVMEVLLSAVSPMQLMTGKILGQAGVSVVMMAVYASLGLAGLSVLAMMDIIEPAHLAYLALYFIMAYFMVAAIMAGVGSAVSDLRDAQALITPAMLVLMIPLLLWLPISENPNGALATITSFIPPLIPFVMILRVTAASEDVALWQIFATLVVGFVATFGMVWMSARVFRVGVLMYGKPPSPVELVRWIRYR